jgi:hypothetical protein
MLGVFLSARYAEDQFATYAEPGDGGSSLALARTKLTLDESSASLDDLKVFCGTARAAGAGSSAPDRLFLAVGDRQRMTAAQGSQCPWAKSCA